MFERAKDHVIKTLNDIRDSGLWKDERVLISPQGAAVDVKIPSGGEREVLNFCANNYLGLANHKRLRIAAKRAIDGSIQYGMGFADEEYDGDQKFHSEGIDIVVSTMSVDLLRDTVLDYVKLDNGEMSFIFKNPNDPDFTITE